jgi:hypothetical protein
MPSLAQLHDQLRNAKHILHIAHTGKHPVSGKEDTMIFEMYKKKPELVREVEENVVALEKAIRDKEAKPKPRKTPKAKKGGRTRRYRRRL